HSDPIETEEEEGKLYLFYGSADGLSAEPVWSFEPNETLNITGFDVSGGDINGDGYSDIAAGCLQWSNDQVEEGRIILFYGSASGLNDTPDWIFEGDQDNGLMGSSVALAGDINADGYNDLFVAAKMYDNGETDEGKTWMFWGSAEGPVGPVWSWEPDAANAISGFPVRYAGDVNGDGFDDVIIGANNHSTYLIEDGLAVAFYGSADGLSDAPDWTKTGGQAKCAFGHFVDGAGDVNGDGYDDVIVSAILYEDDVADWAEGWVFAFYGSATGLSETASWSSQGNNIMAQYGYHIAGAGDVNGDGFSDVVIGAKYWTEDFEAEGATFLFFGSESGLETDYCWKQKGGQANGYLGKTVGGDGGDYNNDGFDDFLVSAYRYTNIYPSDGMVYCIYGKPRESDFTYGSNTFCQSDDNPTPEILGLAGGIFTATSGLLFSDASTGEIDLTLTPTGTYTITYTVEGEFCTVQSKRTIQIVTPSINGTFAYPNDSLFISASNPIPSFYPGAIPGIFSAQPDGIVFTNTATGEINMAESVPGTYTITNTVEDPFCGPTYFTFTLVLVPTCYKPDAPSVQNISFSTATIFWNAIEYADSYDIYI
ncbi:MAG: FG-GAP-like repeat-containing protein, partial [Chitinophagales bacterium]